MDMVPTDENTKPSGSAHQFSTELTQFDRDVLDKGKMILATMAGESKSLFNKDWWYGRIMDWSMQNDQFKTQMFRFVDVLPYLDSGSEVARHLKEYFAENEGGQLPSVFNFGIGMGSLAPGLLAGAVKKNVTQMAKMFITGENAEEAIPVLKKSRKQGLTFTIDLLGEATLSEVEAAEYSEKYLSLVNHLADEAKTWDEDPILDRDENGAIPKVNVSVKITSLFSQVREVAWDQSIVILKERLRPIFRAAVTKGVFINIDMEQFSHKDLTISVFKQLLMEEEFKSYPHFGIVMQAYLRESLDDTRDLVTFAKERGVPFTIRLVKGAYWDYEVIHAKQNGWPIPVYTLKAESDVNYENCAKVLIDGYPFIRLALGSHNVRSIAASLVMAEEAGLPKPAVEIQMLYGMADAIKGSFISQGYRVREYATVGEMIPGMAYLVRRLLENTSNESWLKNKFADDVSPEELLANPKDKVKQPTSDIPQQIPGKFYNHPLLDFAEESHRNQFARALNKVKKSFPVKVLPVIKGKEKKVKETFPRENPSDTSMTVAQIARATHEICEEAIQTAKSQFPIWSKTPVEVRAKVLDDTADLIDLQRFELAALQVLEVGKTWEEADGDICEAIDFCRYYAKEMRRLGKPFRTGHAPGELSLYHYQGKGVAAVIAPWNFPLAILTGMTVASVVTGNTVVVKPAEQSSATALQLMRILKQAGLPDGVVNFVPGFGEEVGEYLTGHKNIDIISFTGSQEVGLRIVKKSADVIPGQKGVKRCIIEMGGKNAIIVDSDADLDEAVDGVLYSAFGFQGQKCSACSRVIVVNSLYDRFVTRLIEAARSIEVGTSENPASYMGPVVDENAAQKIMAMIERAKETATLAFSGSTPQGGHFVPPTIFTDVDPQSEIAQKEVFGPVLAVIKAKNIEDAIAIGNDTEFALTGGIFSRSPANIQKVREDFEVGNLYINRGNTGALVERHPFGGFKMSGVGSKTGGPDYLVQYMDPRVITENTMRRGFAPAEDSDD